MFYHEYQQARATIFRTTGCTNQTTLFLFAETQFRMGGVWTLLKLNSLALFDGFDVSFHPNVNIADNRKVLTNKSESICMQYNRYNTPFTY
jgi:hypothetical protein